MPEDRHQARPGEQPEEARVVVSWRPQPQGVPLLPARPGGPSWARCHRVPSPALLTALLAFLLVPCALADDCLHTGNSFNPVGSGARAMGQGNAFIAVADDATAASWNPAGLTQLERPECSFALERVYGPWHRGDGPALRRPDPQPLE